MGEIKVTVDVKEARTGITNFIGWAKKEGKVQVPVSFSATEAKKSLATVQEMLKKQDLKFSLKPTFTQKAINDSLRDIRAFLATKDMFVTLKARISADSIKESLKKPVEIPVHLSVKNLDEVKSKLNIAGAGNGGGTSADSVHKMAAAYQKLTSELEEYANVLLGIDHIKSKEKKTLEERAKETLKFRKAVQDLQKEEKILTERTDFMNSGFAKFSLVMSGIAATIFVTQSALSGLKALVGVGSEFEKGLANMVMRLGKSAESAEKLSNEFRKISTTSGMKVEDLVQAQILLEKAGLSQQAAKGKAEWVAKATKAGVEPEKAVDIARGYDFFNEKPAIDKAIEILDKGFTGAANKLDAAMSEFAKKFLDKFHQPIIDGIEALGNCFVEHGDEIVSGLKMLGTAIGEIVWLIDNKFTRAKNFLANPDPATGTGDLPSYLMDQNNNSRPAVMSDAELGNLGFWSKFESEMKRVSNLSGGIKIKQKNLEAIVDDPDLLAELRDKYGQDLENLDIASVRKATISSSKNKSILIDDKEKEAAKKGYERLGIISDQFYRDRLNEIDKDHRLRSRAMDKNSNDLIKQEETRLLKLQTVQSDIFKEMGDYNKILLESDESLFNEKQVMTQRFYEYLQQYANKMADLRAEKGNLSPEKNEQIRLEEILNIEKKKFADKQALYQRFYDATGIYAKEWLDQEKKFADLQLESDLLLFKDKEQAARIHAEKMWEIEQKQIEPKLKADELIADYTGNSTAFSYANEQKKIDRNFNEASKYTSDTAALDESRQIALDQLWERSIQGRLRMEEEFYYATGQMSKEHYNIEKRLIENDLRVYKAAGATKYQLAKTEAAKLLELDRKRLTNPGATSAAGVDVGLRSVKDKSSSFGKLSAEFIEDLSESLPVDDIFKLPSDEEVENFGTKLAKGLGIAAIEMVRLKETFEGIANINNQIADKKQGLENLTDIEMLDGQKKTVEEIAQLEEERNARLLSGTRQTFAATKMMFAEQSSARKALNTLELACGVAEIAQMGEKAVMAAVLAASEQGTGGDVYTAFARVAAMLALMATVLGKAGISFGGGGGGDAPAGIKATNYSGTVLGDPEAQSQSVNNVYELLKDIHASEYPELQGIYQEMVELNNNITGLVRSIVQAGGDFSATGSSYRRFESSFEDIKNFLNYEAVKDENLNLMIRAATFFGDPSTGIAQTLVNSLTGPILSSFFKEETWTNAAGLAFKPASVKDVVSDNGAGIGVEQYLDWGKRTEHGWRKDTYEWGTNTAPVDESTIDLINKVFSGAGKTLLAIGKSLGLAQDKIENYVFDIGKVDLLNLNGEEISKKLQATFSTALDKASEVLFKEIIGKYQEVGEGLFETASRLVMEKEIVLSSLASINKAFDGSAVAAVHFSQDLLTSFEDLETFAKNVSTYFEAFFSENEQFETLLKNLSDSFENLNLALPDTREGFRALVESLKLTDAVDRGIFATLMGLADTADDFYSRIEKKKEALALISKDINDALHPLTEWGKILAGINRDFDGYIKTMREYGATVDEINSMEKTRIDVLLKAKKDYAGDIDTDLTDKINQATLSDRDYKVWAATETLNKTLAIVAEMGKEYSYLADKAYKVFQITVDGLEDTLSTAKMLGDISRKIALGYAAAGRPVVKNITEDIAFRNSGLTKEEWLLKKVQDAGVKYNSGGLTITEWEEAMDSVQEWYNEATGASEDAANAWKSAAQTAKDLAKSLRETKESLLMGDLNVALPSEKFAEAWTMYSSKLSAAKGGKPEDVEAFMSFTSEFLSTAKDSLKSSDAYQALFSSVLSEIDALTAMVESQDYTKKIFELEKTQVQVLKSIDQGIVDLARTFTSAIGGIITTKGEEAGISSNSIADIAMRYGFSPSGLHAQDLRMRMADTTADSQWIRDIAKQFNRTEAQVLEDAKKVEAFYDLKGFADGGVSYGPQLAFVSEGAYPAEAHVPLPDGRTIPVSINKSSEDTALLKEIAALLRELKDSPAPAVIDGAKLGRFIDGQLDANSRRNQYMGYQY